MAYLHDKNIVHAKLTSENIFLEPNYRVKISLVDEDQLAIIACAQTGAASPRVQFNLPALTYLSPELIRTIKLLEQPETTTTRGENQNRRRFSVKPQVDLAALSKKSDVFSFGTLLFELFEERFPFSNQHETTNAGASTCPLVDFARSPQVPTAARSWAQPQSARQDPAASSRCDNKQRNGNITTPVCQLIYQIGSGQMGPSNQRSATRRMPACVETILVACWSTEPKNRPQFKQLHFA